MHKKRWKGCMNQRQKMTVKKQCLPDTTGRAHIETHWDWSNMNRSKPDGVSGLKGKVERNPIPNSEAIFKCQLLAEEKKSIFFHWNFTEHTNLTYAHNGQNNVDSVLFLETFFFVFVWAFFSSLTAFLHMCYGFWFCVFIGLCVCMCVCVSAYACIYVSYVLFFLCLFFSFLKSEKGKIWGWMGEEAMRIWEEERRSFD